MGIRREDKCIKSGLQYNRWSKAAQTCWICGLPGKPEDTNSWWNNGEQVWHIDTIVEKGFDVLPIHRWTSHNIAELKGDKTRINWIRIGFKNNNFYIKKQGHAIARSEKQWVQ